MPEDRSTEGKFHLSLKGPGMSIDKVVDLRTAGAIAQLTFGGLAGSVDQVNQRAQVSSFVPEARSQPVSLREYLQGVAPDRGIHMKILAVARYMRDLEDRADFSREDVRSRFRSAGEKQPANFHRDFQKALRAGWIAEDHQSRDRYYVTRSGDDEIEHRQAQVPAINQRRPSRKGRRSLTTGAAADQ
jgi:hypothetical protein